MLHELSSNLKINDIETLLRDENGNPKTVRFHCSFFGQDCIADITAKNIEKGWSSFTGEGPTELYDSFESQITDHWPQITEIFNEHVISEKD